ncbi:MAG: Na+/H+ antiporter [Acidobacteriota bacterium]|nr:Na+/H+ antiporter [Acidobacteriota bacterium]
MENFLATETLIIELLLIVSLVALGVRRLRIPYTVALVVVGLLLTFQRKSELSLTPELILSLFIPPLVFEASFHLDFKSLRENWLPIVGLAIPGVLLTTFIVGAIVSWGVGISLTSGLVFGALIAATDPVAVVALFKALGAPKRLNMLVESESLFNDGTAIVVFKLILAVALSTVIGNSGEASESFDFLAATVDFFRVSAGGLLIGLSLGWIIAQIIARVDDYLIETMLTTVLAFGAYLVAERFHVSGVLSVVAAGIITGNIGLRKMSPTTRIVLFNFWEFLAFVANSLVFLLIGLDVNLREMGANLFPIAIALVAVLLSRALVVYGLTWLTNLRGVNKVPLAYRHVIFWGGLRGAISLALALSLPLALAERELLRVMTFGVVLFTLLAQGTTMQFLMRRLGIGQPARLELEYERRHGRLIAAQAALRRIEEMHANNLFSVTIWQQIEPGLRKQVEVAVEAQNELLEKHPELQFEECADARLESLNAQRASLATMYSSGLISETVYEELIEEVDEAIARIPNENLTTNETLKAVQG